MQARWLFPRAGPPIAYAFLAAWTVFFLPLTIVAAVVIGPIVALAFYVDGKLAG